MYTTRSEVNSLWPTTRKGTKYVAMPDHSKNNSISLLILIKDILCFAKTRKEVKKILQSKKVSVNGKVVVSEKFSVQGADIVSFEDIKKNYRLIIKNKKFGSEEVSGKDAEIKIVKVIGKRMIGNKKVQINLRDGQNILVNEPVSVGDSVKVNIKSKKIEKVLPLKEGCNIEMISGKYAGEEGKLSRVESRERKKVYIVKIKNKEIGVGFDFIKSKE